LLSDALSSTVDGLARELVEVRRDLHAHPELARTETRTTTLVARHLEAAGIRVRPLPGTGLVADLGPRDAAYRVALRADLDALPVLERTGLPWASVHDGICHACGHDVHTSALLGAGLALRAHEDAWCDLGVAVRLIFQPAE
jgi:amidohydrolase